MPRILPLSVAVFAAALAATPAAAQAPPELTDLGNGARIQIRLLKPNPSAQKPEKTIRTATIHHADADSIAFQLNGSGAVRVVPWGQVKELYLSQGRRPIKVTERLGFAAGLTFIGAIAGYSWWHSCNDPESEAIWSCIVAPRRLGTSVRFGTWAGLTVGALTALGVREVEEWRSMLRTDGPRLLIDHHARSGFMVGVNFRF